jgi:hypothetical protein
MEIPAAQAALQRWALHPAREGNSVDPSQTQSKTAKDLVIYFGGGRL